MAQQLRIDGMPGSLPVHKQKPNTTTIDFGIGSMTIYVQPGSSITVNELVDALEKLAMVVPLQQVINVLNRLK